MRTELERIAFIRTQTRVEPVPFVPEIRVHTASELSPLWAATQSFLDLRGLDPPYWAFPWAGGQALARWVLDTPEVVRDKTVLDFASGSGLVAIAAALAGARHVIANDIDPVACSALRLNAEVAGVAIEALSADIVGSEVDAEVVLVGDVFYERDAAARFHDWLGRIAGRGAGVYVGDPGRTYLPAGLLGLAEYDVPVSSELESAENKRTTVFGYRGALDGSPGVR
jgi:predicted nicotinamide N-methyase